MTNSKLCKYKFNMKKEINIMYILCIIMKEEGIYNMDFGTRLKNLRMQRGLSQRQLAQIIGCSHQSIAIYEQNGNMEKIKILQKLCEFFGVSMDYLINGMSSMTTNELTDKEIQVLFQYRVASDYQKSIVDHVLKIESTKN